MCVTVCVNPAQQNRFGFITHIHVVKSPQIVFGKGRENHLPMTFKRTNQICYCQVAKAQHLLQLNLVAFCQATQCSTKLLPKQVRNTVKKILQHPFLNSFNVKMPSSSCKTAIKAASTLVSLQTAIVYNT